MEIEDDVVMAWFGVDGSEDLIGTENLGCPAIQFGVPIRIVAIEQDNVPRLGEVGGQVYVIGRAGGR